MAVTHPTAVRTGIADFVVDQIDEGTPPGTLTFQTSGGSTVCVITLNNPAFGAAASGVATLDVDPVLTSAGATAGTIAKAEFRNQAGTAKILCAVSTTGSDINIPGGLTLATNDTVTVTSLTYTAPA
jgi:hypothetical protein